MNIYLAWTLAVLYWIAFPIYWILYFIAIGLFFLLRPLYTVLLFLIQPVVYLGIFIAYIVAWPFQFLKRFETLYIFLGVGGIVGLAFGLIIHFASDYIASALNLDSQKSPEPRDAREYRETRRERKRKEITPIVTAPPGLFLDDSPPRGRHGLLAQVIHEEGDSDF